MHIFRAPFPRNTSAWLLPRGFSDNLKHETSLSKDGQTLCLKKGMIKCEQNIISFVLFGSLIGVVNNDKYRV